jgi:hypothetical protein
MFSNPCKCCGSYEHALLITSGKDVILIDFECPVIRHEKVEDMLRERSRDKMYEPCPEKFANLYGYQRAEVMEALKQFDKAGIGKYWNWPSCIEFNEKVLDSCVNYSRQVIFKRDQSLECYYVGEIELTSDEDDSSIIA